MSMVHRYVQFAKAYVQMTEALQQEGVPEWVAREEARHAATSLLINAEEHTAAYDPASGPCPTCGRG